jgi:predicted protein tyrosine phosphatase
MTTLTEKIRNCQDGVIDNPYQGKDKKVLFVCSAGILRSATGARLYAHKYNTRCAGTGLDYALVPLSERLMDWADEIVFVHPYNYDNAEFHFDLTPYKDYIKVLNIPDQHEHMADGLKKAFEEQYEPIEEPLNTTDEQFNNV